MIRAIRTGIHWFVFLILIVSLLIGLCWLATGSITLRQHWFGPLWKTFRFEECLLEFSAITLSIDGSVELENPVLTLIGEQDPVFTFDSAQTIFSLRSWWNQEDYMKQIELVDGRLYISRRHSPTGNRYPVMRQIELVLQKQDSPDTWQMKLEGVIEEVTLRVTGDQLPSPFSFAGSEKHEPSFQPRKPDEWRQQFNEFSQKWSMAWPWLKSVSRGTIEATLQQDGEGEWIFENVAVQAAGISHPDWGTIDHIDAVINQAFITRLQPPAAGSILISNYKGALPSLAGEAEVESLSIRFRKGESDRFYIIHYFMDDLQWSGYQLDSLFSRNRWYLEEDLFISSLQLSKDQQSLRIHYEGERLPRLKGTLTGAGTLDPMVWIEASGLDWHEELKWNKPPERVYSYFQFDISEEERIDSAYFEIIARDFGWENLPEFHLLKTRGHWQDQGVHLESLTLNGENFSLSGYGFVHPDQQQFSARLGGSLEPLPWSPELPQWWEDLWKDFAFDQSIPLLEVAASGKWGTGTPDFQVEGKLELEDFLYRGVDIQSLNLGIVVSPGFLWLRDMTIVTPEGAGQGDVWRKEAVPFDGISHYFFDVQSRIPPHDLARLIDTEVEEIVAEFEFFGSTFVHGRGSIFTGKSPFLEHADCELLIVSESPVRIDPIPLDWVSTRVLLGESRVGVRNLIGRMANGLLSGDADGYFTEEPATFSLNATLDQADLLPFIAIWKTESPEQPAHSEVDDSNPDQPDNSGTLHLEIELSGPWQEWNNLMGKGSFLITDGNFQRINLLGFLSAILPITSLEFEELKGSFNWIRDTLQFPDMEIIGPTTSISAKGDYHIPNNEMNFMVKVFYLHQAPVLRILSPIFHPFAHLLEVRIWGNFDNPEWRFHLDPRNLFSSDS